MTDRSELLAKGGTAADAGRWPLAAGRWPEAFDALAIAVVHIGRSALAVGLRWAQQAKNLLADQGECEEVVWLA